jgi:hypothetical protein
MIRSLILGSVAFAGVFVASQQFHIINAMAEMSGSPTLARKFGKILLESFGQLGGDRAEQTKSFLEGMVGDVIRYARIKGM